MTTYEYALMEELETADPFAPDWRESRAYRLWRIVVIQRDGCCVFCGSKQGRHAHHVNHASYFQELRFDANNGVTLCGQCHLRYHNDYHRSTRVKCTEYDFMNCLRLVCHFNVIWTNLANALISEDREASPAESAIAYQNCVAAEVQAAYSSSEESVVKFIKMLKAFRG